MHRCSATRVRALLLALFLALGSGGSLVHAGLMELAVLADSGHPGAGDCDGCDDGHDCATEADNCLAQCASAGQGLLPAEPVASTTVGRAARDVVALMLGDRSSRPAHGPPKPLAPAEA
jgi:hypothetical protein